MEEKWQSCFEKTFDVAVYGAGYAGFAAAMSLHKAGRSVLLMDTRGDVLWESGRAFMLECGSSSSSEWSEWHNRLRSRCAAGDGMVDGALAEIIASHWILESGLTMLDYVQPVALEKEGKNIVAVILATKSGAKRITARQWIDASETGLLLRLACPGISPRGAEKLNLFAYFERNDWPAEKTTFQDTLKVEDIKLFLRPTLWNQERCLHMVFPGNTRHVRSFFLNALEHVRSAAPEIFRTALLTHCSIEPLAEYGPGADAEIPARPSNLAVACPVLSPHPVVTLADRFELGLRAVEFLKQCPAMSSKAAVGGNLPEVLPFRVVKAEAGVAGAGTGGAIAAIAAARQGASVVCFDLMSFPGGIGSGGGIHVYYYGAPGGLQNEIDQRVQAVQGLFGQKNQILGFHPDAKKLVLEKIFDEEGICFFGESMIYEVVNSGGRITSVMLATPLGPIRLEAEKWVDGTGDGDLAVFAGAAFRQGRITDGLPHAYSQSSGLVKDNPEGLRRMELVNYDAGWCDPADPEDLTRARLWGICQYFRAVYSDNARTTYLAPAIGLRQSRQIECDLMLELGDFVEHRRFDDCIGFSAGHYDSHIADYEFESDEGLFWVWFTRCGFTKSACEISYRMLLPAGIKNLWIGCRAAGRTHDAQFPVRMQRDMQRIGEVCGVAAALAAREGVDSRQLSFSLLRKHLLESGAINVESASQSSEFRWEDDDVFVHEYKHPSLSSDIQDGLKAMERGEASAKLWHVYRNRQTTQTRVAELLHSGRAETSWLAAGVMAMWGDEQAEARLLKAVENFEDGFPVNDGTGANGRGLRPESNHWYQFNWVVAVSMLRMCGTQRCLDTFACLAKEEKLPFNIRTAIAVTITRLGKRGCVNDVPKALAILDDLLEGRMPGRYVSPQRRVARICRAWLDKRSGKNVDDDELNDCYKDLNGAVTRWTDPCEDHMWQLHLAVAQAWKSLGLPPHPAAQIYLHDERSLVRQAFKRQLYSSN